MTALRTAAQQALEALEADNSKLWPSEKRTTAITALKAALAQQAEPTGKQPLQVESVATTQQPAGETPPSDYRRGYWDGFNIGKREGRIEAEDALAQQDEPDHETQAELAEQQVVQLAEERDHYRNLWQKAQEQAEPLNLSDPAVRKRLASQWGYVPAAAQAEPVEPVAVPLIDYEALIAAAYAANKKWAQGTSGCVAFKHGAEWFRLQTLAAMPQQAEPVRLQQMADAGFKPRDRRLECDECGGKFTAQMLPIHKCAQQDEPVEPVAQFDLNTMPGQADAHLRALLRYTENFYATAIEHGMRAGPTANAIAHVERAGKALHQIVHAQAKMLEPARPVEPVAWECKAGGLKPLTQRQYDAQTAATKRHYTRIAPPQRTMVPLTEEEILAAVGWERAAMYMKLAPNFPVDEAKKETLTNARAVEKASWEKNHG